MAIIFEDDFESGSLVAGGWTVSTSYSGAAVRSACSAEKTVDNYYAETTYYTEIIKALGSSYSALWFQFCWLPNSGTYGPYMWRAFDGSTVLASVRLNNNADLLTVRIHPSTDVISVAVNPNFPYVVDIKYVPDPSAGQIEVRINGESVGSFTGRTVPSSQTTLNTFSLGSRTECAYAWFDNVKVDNANWISLPASYVSLNTFEDDPDCLFALKCEYANYIRQLQAVPLTASSGTGM